MNSKNRMRCADNEEPTFDEGRCTDVSLRCPNGRLRGVSTAAIYTVLRVNMEGEEPDADVLGYSYSEQFGCPFIETVAARDAFGRFWNFSKEGSPCYDPYDDAGELRPPPAGRFLMWDEPEEDDEGIPSPTRASLTIYDAREGEPTGDVLADLQKRKAIRRYKFVLTQPTINDMVAIETEGDKLFLP